MADETVGMRYDTAIVGAGPAGMSAAMNCEGESIVIERLKGERFDRYHSICGEAVSERAFRRIGWRPEAIVKEVDTIRISCGDRSIDLGTKGYIVNRPEMLREMRELCDSKFVKGSVTSVSVGDEGYRLLLDNGTEIECRSLIGADGAHSVVRRDVFGFKPKGKIPIVNCIAKGDGGSVLEFRIDGRYAGGYGWRFPSAEGKVSVGFPSGMGSVGDVEGLLWWGARHMPFGVPDSVVSGRCLLAGDAACLANPLCYGGIGIAMQSGRKAAESLISDNPNRYQRWISRSRMFDPRFYEAHERFCRWSSEEMNEALSPFLNGTSMRKGILASLAHPSRFSVYAATFFALRLGW